MKHWLSVFWGAAGLAALSAAAAPPRPNILFILTDDLGFGDVGVFHQNLRQAAGVRSQPWFFTPQLDALAAEGAQLTQHYCPAPVCAPSRASLLLGVHQGHANVRDNQFDKALANNHTLATTLGQAGYTTACIGKWGLQGSAVTAPPDWPAHPLNRGFDYYYGYIRHSDGHEHYPKEGLYRGVKEVWDNRTEMSAGLDQCYTTDLFAARSKQWIRDHHATNAAAPFFLYLAFDTPHAVLELPTQSYPAGGGTNGGLQWLGTPGQMINTASGTVDSYRHPNYAGATWDHDNNPATAEQAWPDVYQRYATSVQRIDDCVGDLLQLLRDLDLDDHTLVVFSSDNGPSVESYLPENYAANFFDSYGPFDGIKRDCWEGGIRVPTLARWPGTIPAGQTNTVPSGFWDWMATFCELAGVPAPARSDGVSLVPSLTGRGTQQPSTVYVEYFNNSSTPSYAEFEPAHRGRPRNQMQMLRLGDMVGVRYDITSHADNFEIYNVVSDPKQTTNLAGQPAYAALQQQMKDTVLRARRPDSAASRPYDSELVPAVNPSPVTQGVAWRACLQTTPWVPELTWLTPVATGHTNRPLLAVRPRDEDVGLLFAGYLQVPGGGDYTFHLAADTGAVLRLHEATVIDADFGYLGGSEVSATIRLQAGKHPFRLYYARGTAGSPALNLQWSGPGIVKQAIPDSAFYRDGTAPPGPPSALDDHASTTAGVPVLIDVLANDWDDGTPQSLALQGVGNGQAGQCVIEAGQIRYTPTPGFLGDDSFPYTVTDGQDPATGRVTVAVFYQNSNLVWLPFNHSSGWVVEESGGLPMGVLFGYPDGTSPWGTGRYGRGLQFDGADDRCALTGYKGVTGTAARTVAFWARVPAGVSNRPTFISWGANNGSGASLLGRRFDLLLDNNNGYRLRAEFNGGGMNFSTADLSDLRNDQWVHCAIVVPSGAQMQDVLGYLNGQPATGVFAGTAGNETRAVDTDPVHDVQLGDWQSGDRAFAGWMDEVRLYDRALSAGEVAALAGATAESAAAWHRRYFGDAPLEWAGDDDGDQQTRLNEYAFGGQPQLPNLAPRVDFAWPVDRLQLTFTRRLAGTHELAYQLEWSPDLALWLNLNVNEIAAVPGSDAPGFERVTIEVPPVVPARNLQFIRLRATLPGT